MAARNADEPNTDNTGRPEPDTGKVLIQAITTDDLHLGDERILYGRGDGEHGAIDPDTREPFAYPNKAHVTPAVADELVKNKKARRV